MRPFLRRLRHRFAVALSLVAAFAFVLDAALAFDSPGTGAVPPSAYHGTYVHFHLPAQGHAGHHQASGHQHQQAVADADAANPDEGTMSADGTPDCHFAGSYVGVMLPCAAAQAGLVPPVVNLAHRPRHASGVEPDNPRKPPRTGTLH